MHGGSTSPDCGAAPSVAVSPISKPLSGERAFQCTSYSGLKGRFSASRSWRSLTQLRKCLALILCANVSSAVDVPVARVVSIKHSFSTPSNRRFPWRRTLATRIRPGNPETFNTILSTVSVVGTDSPKCSVDEQVQRFARTLRAACPESSTFRRYHGLLSTRYRILIDYIYREISMVDRNCRTLAKNAPDQDTPSI